MSTKPNLEKITKLIASVCAQDEIISSTELDASFEQICKIKKVSRKKFDGYIDKFFNEKESVEEYFFNCMDMMPNHELLDMCRIAATSDGFSLRENYAFIKLCRLANEDPATFHDHEV